MGDNDFPVQFLRRFAADKFYGQTGTDIPSFGIGSSAEGGSGTGIEPYYQEKVVATEPAWGGSPQREIPKEELEKMRQPGSPPPAGFFEDLRKTLGTPGVKQASTPSFDLAPDIDSPEIDAAIANYRQRYGAPYVSPNVRGDARAAGRRIREMLKGPVRGV